MCILNTKIPGQRPGSPGTTPVATPIAVPVAALLFASPAAVDQIIGAEMVASGRIDPAPYEPVLMKMHADPDAQVRKASIDGLTGARNWRFTGPPGAPLNLNKLMPMVQAML